MMSLKRANTGQSRADHRGVLRADLIVIGALTLIFSLTSCAAVQDEPVELNENSQDGSESEVPESTEPEIEVSECSQLQLDGIEKTINAQTASFAVGDYELAYSYASESFRGSVTLDRFVGIIQGSYGPLINSSTLSFDNCLFYPAAPLATIDVRFTEAGSEVYALRYVMVESELGWRVDGASALESIGAGV